MNKKLLFGLLSFALFSVLLGACKIIDANTLPKAQSVEMGSSQFIQKEVTIQKGESVNLVNQPTTNHVIANGVWDASGKQDQTKEPKAPGLPDQGVNIASGASLPIGPFTQAGDYYIYCNIHPGMNLVVHVK
jgi:plastocyanin